MAMGVPACYLLATWRSRAPGSQASGGCRDAARPGNRPSRGSSAARCACGGPAPESPDRKSTRLNSSHTVISYAVFCLKKKRTPSSYATDKYLYIHSAKHHHKQTHTLI